MIDPSLVSALARESKFLFYADQRLSEEIETFTLPDSEIGKESRMTVYAKNISGHKLTDLKFTSFDKDVTIIPSSTICESQQAVELTIRFTPNEDRTKSLKSSIEVSGRGWLEP
jgi:hypothetical protein